MPSPGPQVILAPDDRDYEQATFEIELDYDLARIDVRVSCSNGIHYFTFDGLPRESMVSRSVFLGAINNCWDGRDDQKGWFDNVIVEGIPWVEQTAELRERP